jgi:hypothetical protein
MAPIAIRIDRSEFFVWNKSINLCEEKESPNFHLRSVTFCLLTLTSNTISPRAYKKQQLYLPDYLLLGRKE